jgi:iron complex outermembrane recepter protein
MKDGTRSGSCPVLPHFDNAVVRWSHKLIVTCLLALSSTATSAQTAAPASTGRADENAITQAEDAFGSSIGTEEVGLYSSSDVRGFSPTRAGNVRVEGLYFDQVWSITSRLRRSTSIRIGLTALGYPFPAPTGVVDYTLRKPGGEPSLTVGASGDSYGAATFEVDAALPLIKDKLSIGAGIGLYNNSFYNGTDNQQHIEALQLRWTPSPNVEIIPFWARSDIYDDEIGPYYVPAGSFLPPKVKRRRFNGPDWAEYNGTAINYGAISRFNLSPNWQLRTGLFRSIFDNDTGFTQLLTGLTHEGQANRLIISDPPDRLASTSGEVRLSRKFFDGPRLHQVHLSLRARDRGARYDGSAFIDLGPTTIDEVITGPPPAFAFTEQSRDRVRQWTGGIAYEGRWKDVGELSIGVQKTDYRKRIQRPGLPDARTTAKPWLFNIAAAAYLSDSLAVYGGYTRGLEESGVAPDNASNRDEALPAIRTNQKDIGIRWAITPKIKLVAGLFDIRKPYFNLDAAGRFDLLGDTRNRGIEMSLSGSLTERLDVLLGAVVSDPEVTGEGVALGRLGPKPVGQAARKIDFNLDWRPPIVEGLSLNLAVAHSGKIVSTRDNLVSIPARTLVDIGGRYGFKLGDNPASLRLSVTNLFNEYGYELRGAGSYDLIPGRVASARLVVDF